MIILTPRNHRPEKPRRIRRSPWHHGFEFEHKKLTLEPGTSLTDAVARPGQLHMLSLFVDDPHLATVTLDGAPGLELWLLMANFKPLQGPEPARLQAMVGPGGYWIQIGASAEQPNATGGYKVRLHCSPLGSLATV